MVDGPGVLVGAGARARSVAEIISVRGLHELAFVDVDHIIDNDIITF